MNLHDYFRHAWFADLAYVDWGDDALGEAANAASLIRDANAAKRAPEIVDDDDQAIGPALASRIFLPANEGWHVADFHRNDPASGFAATLFARGSGPAAQKVLAIRGTEVGLSFEVGRDLLQAGLQEIGGIGLAASQAVALINYVQRLGAPTGHRVSQWRLAQGAEPPRDGTPVLQGAERAYWLEATRPASGLGLLAPGETLSVTGHSLGGHLAALALRLFPARFDDAVTFNAPGFDPRIGVNDIDGLLAGLAGAVGASGVAAALQILTAVVEKGQQLSGSFIDRLFAPILSSAPAPSFGSLALDGRLFSLVAEQSGAYDDISVVAAPFITGRPASDHLAVATESNSHAMGQLVDALGVQALLARIDPGIDLARAGRLLALASPRAAASEEALVTALGRLLVDTPLAALPEAVARGIEAWFAAPAPYAARGLLHARLIALEETVGADGLGTLIPLGGIDTTTMVAGAFVNPAWRYALLELDPFVLGGSPALFAGHAAQAQPAADALPFWQERARMLAKLLAAHHADTATAHGIAYELSSGNVDWVDEIADKRFAEVALDGLAAGLRSNALDAMRGLSGPPAIIGFAARETAFLGSVGDDRLYGDGAANRLLGLAGHDRLYGGDGDDWLFHAAAMNVDDQVPDHLAGGRGFDRYHVGDGDRIADSDGRGEIRVGAEMRTLDGVYRRVGAQVYRNEALAATLYLRPAAATLVARADGDTVRIELVPATGSARGFVSGDFGIVLGDDARPRDGLRHVAGTPGDDRDSRVAALVGSAADERIDGLDGDDDLFGGNSGRAWGRDWLLGGAGDDYLNSATLFEANETAQYDDAGDFLVGGDGRDVAIGNAGADVLLGGPGADFLSGRGGDDVQDGGPGDDVLAGGGGADRLFGGEGDDFLLGALDVWASAERAWAATPTRDAEGRIIDLALRDIFVGSPSSADADVLYGGAGDDYLDGGDGADVLHGEAGRDVLFGWYGADVLAGGDGDDILYGDTFGLAPPHGDGDDELDGGAGDDELHGGGGADRLSSGAGNDRLFGGAGYDRLDGGDGNDFLDGGDGGGHLVGGAGADVIRGGAGADVLEGGPGDDELSGGAGNDVLNAGPGDDRIAGGRGHDTYLYHGGPGHVRISDTGGWDTVLLADPAMLDGATRTLDGRDLVFDFSSTSRLTLVGWLDGGIDRVVAGASELRLASDRSDRSDRFARRDDPADPDDVYTFIPQAGSLRIDDADGSDVLVLDDGIGVADLAGIVGADGHWRATIDNAVLEIADWAESALSRVVLASGEELTHAALEQAARYAPRAGTPLPDQVAIGGFDYHYRVPADTFSAGDFGPLMLSAARNDGSALPAWLAFNPSEGTFSGRPAAGDGGRLAIAVTARSAAGYELTDTFTLRVEGMPQGAAPVLDPRLLDGARGSWLGSAPPSLATVPALRTTRGAAVGFPLPPAPAAPRHLERAQGIGDVNGDGFDDVLFSERFGPAGYAGVDRHHVVLGRAGGFARDIDTLSEAQHGRAFEILLDDPLMSVAAGDVDGDGLSDLLLTPDGDELVHVVVYGATSNTGSVDVANLGVDEGYAFASSHMFDLVDANGDGVLDIHTGRAVLYGDPSRQRHGIVDPHAAGAGGFVFAADAGLADFAIRDIHGIGDFDGDGRDDFLMVAAPTNGLDPAFHIVRGPAEGLTPGFDIDTAARITLRGDLARGGSVAHGDFNGDGLADVVVVGAARVGDRNEQRIIFGTSDTALTSIDTDQLDGRNGFVVSGAWDIEGLGRVGLGREAVTLGDLDGDGRDELALTHASMLSAAGHAFVPILRGRAGPHPARLDLAALDGAFGFNAMLPLNGPGQHFSRPVAAGDIDGDGHEDLLVVGDEGFGYVARGGSAMTATLVAGTAAADVIEAEAADSVVYAYGGDDEIRVHKSFGVTVDAGRGDDIILIDAEPLPGDVPLGVTPLAWARQRPVVVVTGEGNDHIRVNGTTLSLHILAGTGASGSGNDLSIGRGYESSKLRLVPGSIKLEFGPEHGAIHLQDFDPLDILGGPRSIGRVHFADGTALSYEQLVARGFDIDAGDGDDIVHGTNVVDRIRAGDGNDRLHGRAGDDTLYGGRGDDTYLWHPGDGTDLIVDRLGDDVLHFGGGIALSDLTLARSGADLRVDYAGGGGVRIEEWYQRRSGRIETVTFDDGSAWDLPAYANTPPRPAHGGFRVPYLAGEPLIFSLPSALFRDDDGDPLYVTAAQADGGALPEWLRFERRSHLFQGRVPEQADADIELVLRAWDRHATAELPVTLTPLVPTLPMQLALEAPWPAAMAHTDAVMDAVTADDAARGSNAQHDPQGLQQLIDAMAGFGASPALGNAFSIPALTDTAPVLAAAWTQAA